MSWVREDGCSECNESIGLHGVKGPWSRRVKRAKVALLFVLATALALVIRVLRGDRQMKGVVSAMTANKEIVRRLVEGVWGERNLAVIDELVAPGYIGHSATQPEPLLGPKGFKEFVGVYQAAFPDATITIEDLVAEGDRVATRWTGRGTHKGELMGIDPTGKEVTVSGFTISRIADGQVAEEWELFDALGMLAQLGVVPEFAQA